MGLSAHNIIDAYHHGIIVAGECVDELCRLAASTRPSTFVELVSPEFVGRIRERADSIPRAENLISSVGDTFSRDIDTEEWKREREFEKVRYVEGLRAWKTYFESIDREKYEDFVRRNIEIGLRQIENGEGIPHEEAKRRLSRWIGS